MTSLQIPQPILVDRPEAGSNSCWLDGRHGLVELSWRTGLLEQIRSYVGSTYVSRGGRSSDVGGLLYGKRTWERIQVLTWRPIVRGKDATSHFYLNSKEEQGLSRMIHAASSDASLGGLVVVGWFRSRTKSEPELELHDVQFHEKFFGAVWQFAMVIRPSHQRPADAAIYFRNEEREFELGQPTATLRLAPGPVSVTEPIAGIALEEVSEKTEKRFPWGRTLALVALAGLLAMAAVLILQWNEQRAAAARTADRLGFELVFDGADLKARWNPASTAVMGADTAQLILGGERVQLSHAELAQGFLRVPMKAGVEGDTEVSLKVGDREEVAQLVVAAR